MKRTIFWRLAFGCCILSLILASIGIATSGEGIHTYLEIPTAVVTLAAWILWAIGILNED